MNKIQKISGHVIGLSLILMAAAAFWSMGSLLGEFQTADSVHQYELLKENQGDLSNHLNAWIVIIILDLLVSIAIITRYHRVHPTRAVLTGVVRLIYTFILVVAYSSLSLGLTSFNTGVTIAEFGQITIYLEEFFSIWNLGLIVFGVHLILWARLISKPKIVERILQVLLFVAGAGYIITSGGPIVWEGYAEYGDTVQAVLMLPMVVGELGMGIFLLIQSIRSKKA